MGKTGFADLVWQSLGFSDFKVEYSRESQYTLPDFLIVVLEQLLNSSENAVLTSERRM
jgi:hypothetical protein